jgi:hypothetical protein
MIKNYLLATTVALSTAIFLAVPGQAADAPSKGADAKSSGQKPGQQRVEKAGPNATANALKAFEKVSQELYPKAKQEGNLVVYSVWDVEHIRAVTDAFAKRYPGIKTAYWQGRNPEIVTQCSRNFKAAKRVSMSCSRTTLRPCCGPPAPWPAMKRSRRMFFIFMIRPCRQ